MKAGTNYLIGGACFRRQPHSLGINIYILLGGLAFVASLLLVLLARDIRGMLALGYILQVTAYIALNQSRHQYALIRMLQPSMISMMYIGSNFAIGAWGFNSGNAVNILAASSYHYWPNIEQVYSLVSFCLFLFYLLSLRELDIPISDVPLSDRTDQHALPVKPAIIFLFFCLFASTGLTFSVFSQTKTVVSAALLYIIFEHKIRYKLLLVILIIWILASASADSKREAIFAIPTIFLFALSYRPLEKLTLQRILIGVVASASVTILILAMSIIRGYGNFNADGIFDAVLYIPQYLELRNSIGLILNNFELSYIFLHAHNSISVALQGDSTLAHGETYIRALLVGPIGDLLGYKPASIIDQYTGTMFPQFRANGGSFGITSIGEAVWNFGALAPFPLILIYFGLDSLFAGLVKMIRSQSAWSTILALNCFQFMLYYTRGSGLDIMLIYTIFSVFGGLLFALPIKMLNLGYARRGTA